MAEKICNRCGRDYQANDGGLVSASAFGLSLAYTFVCRPCADVFRFMVKTFLDRELANPPLQRPDPIIMNRAASVRE